MAASTSSLCSPNPRIAFSATKSTAISNPLSQTLSFPKSFHGLRLSAAAPPSLSLSPAKSFTVKASAASQHVEFDRSKELEKKSHSIRRSLKQELRKAGSLKDKWEIHGKIQSLPRKFAPTRIRRRCFVTGRARSVYRDFGLSRHVLREMVHACLLPGSTRSSW